MFKHALIYGMTSHEFWFENPQDYFVYQDAFAEKEKKRHSETDIIAWQYSRYNYLAFSQVIYDGFCSKTKRTIFPKQPISLQEENKNESLLAKFERIAETVNMSFRNKKCQKE